MVLGSAAGPDALMVKLHVKDAGFYRQVAGNGSVGAGEAYMDGLWSCDDLVALIRLLVRNRDLLDGMETGVARLGGYAMKALHALQAQHAPWQPEEYLRALRPRQRLLQDCSSTKT